MKGSSGGVFSYAAGTSGSYTVPPGSYVTGITCHATSAGSLVISGGATITIPAGSTFSASAPLLGTNNQIPAGSTLVFTGTDAYVVFLD
jgi:hypothetical protein